MSTASTPPQGSYFELLKDKYPDLAEGSGNRLPRRRAPKRRAGRLGSLRSRRLLLLSGVALSLALCLSVAVVAVSTGALQLRPTPFEPVSAGAVSRLTAPSPMDETVSARESLSMPDASGGEGALFTALVPLESSIDVSAAVPASRLAPELIRPTRPNLDWPPGAVAQGDEPGDPRVTSDATSSNPSVPESAVGSSVDSRSLDARPSESQPSESQPSESQPSELEPFGTLAETGPQNPPRKVVFPAPKYPAGALRAGAEGRVVVEAKIDSEGRVIDTRVVNGHSPAFDRAAREALGRWQFEPATRDGRAIASQYRVSFDFVLEDVDDSTPAATLSSVPVEISESVKPPRRIATSMPAYPNAAWSEGVKGDVLVRAVIDEQGAVRDVEVLKGLPYGMTEAAVAAIRQWKFEPATRKGVPVAVYRNLSVRFET